MTAEILNVIDTDESLQAALRESEREVGRLRLLIEHLEFENQHLRNEVERLQKQPSGYAHAERAGHI